MRHVQVDAGYRIIGEGAWRNCQHLQIVHLDSTVTSLQTQVFYRCYALRRVIAPGCKQFGGKGVMGALMELASPGQCDIHLIHAEDDLLCDWRPSLTQVRWGLPPSLHQLKTQMVELHILSLAEVGATASADHLIQMATMPLEHKPTALGIPYAIPVSYQFEGAEELVHSLHALFGLLASANTPRYCPQATGFGQQLYKAAGTDSAHILAIALSVVSALQSGRSTLAIAGVFGAGKTRSQTFLLAWFALTTNLHFGVSHKENPAGRAITKLLSSLDLNEDQQALFIRPVGKKEANANTASTKYDKSMFHSTGLIPGARVVIATAGLIWEQKGQAHAPLRAHMESLNVLVCEEAQQDMDLKSTSR